MSRTPKVDWVLFLWKIRHWPHVDQIGEALWYCTKCISSIEIEEGATQITNLPKKKRFSKFSRCWAIAAGVAVTLLLVIVWAVLATAFLELNTLGYYVALLIAAFGIYKLGTLTFYRVRFYQLYEHYYKDRKQDMQEDTREEKLLKDIFADPATRASREAKEQDLDKFIKAAKAATVETIEKHELGRGITVDDVYIVWFVKVLQNWKALVSTTDSDGMYYEVTYNGDRCEAYVDAYSKYANNVVSFL